jgi:hypothetical protein
MCSFSGGFACLIRKKEQSLTIFLRTHPTFPVDLTLISETVSSLSMLLFSLGTSVKVSLLSGSISVSLGRGAFSFSDNNIKFSKAEFRVWPDE